MEHMDLTKENVMCAVMAAFPTVETFRVFRRDRRNLSAANRFIALAYEKKLLAKKTEGEFEILVRKGEELAAGKRPPVEFTFDALIAEIKKERSVKSLIQDMEPLGAYFGLKAPNEVLFTRLKQEFHTQSFKRQHALILFAIWLGLHKPFLHLNYAILAGFPRNPMEATLEEMEGVVLSFAFQGETIDARVVEFLQEQIPLCAQDLELVYVNAKRVFFTATTCTVRIPLRQNAPGYPAGYGEGVSDALALAYQVLVTWQLSDLNVGRVSLAIGIDAGVFREAESSVKALFAVGLPEAYPLRLSHAALVLAQTAEIRVSFTEIKGCGCWGVSQFPVLPYYRSPRRLQAGAEGDREMLPVTDASYKIFREDILDRRGEHFPVLATILRQPPRQLLLKDIARLLASRRMFHESDYFLSHVRCFDGTNQTARAIRMYNLIYMANAAPDANTADLFFRRAEEDARLIEQTGCHDPEFYVACCVLAYSRALKLLRRLRRGDVKEAMASARENILAWVNEAEKLALRGMTVSPTGGHLRSGFWMARCRAMGRLLELDPDLMKPGSKPLTDVKDAFGQTARELFTAIGWMVPGERGGFDEAYFDRRASQQMDRYLAAASSENFRASMTLTVAGMTWDFAWPERRAKMADTVLALLETARQLAEKAKASCLGINTCRAVLSPAEFLCNVDAARDAVLKVKAKGNFDTDLRLGLLGLDAEPGSEPVTFDLIKRESRKK